MTRLVDAKISPIVDPLEDVIVLRLIVVAVIFLSGVHDFRNLIKP